MLNVYIVVGYAFLVSLHNVLLYVTKMGNRNINLWAKRSSFFNQEFFILVFFYQEYFLVRKLLLFENVFFYVRIINYNVQNFIKITFEV